MSFPNIPDIEPVIDIDLSDAVNLLLSSIAMEEMSLSRLMDAEHDKIHDALECCKRGGCTLHDVTAVNKSAEDMMKTLIKLQMLLQFKLENIRELVPCTTTSTTTSSTTTTSTTCTRSTTTKPCRSGCCLMGTARGCVEDRRDPFYSQPFSLHVFLPDERSRERSLRYAVGDEHQGLSFYASGRDVAVTCPGSGQAELLLQGTGRLKRFRREGGDLTGDAAYTLTVRKARQGRLAFRMRLSSHTEPRFEYDSGFIGVSRPSDLRMEVC